MLQKYATHFSTKLQRYTLFDTNAQVNAHILHFFKKKDIIYPQQ